MKLSARVVFAITCTVGALVGLGHFFIPYVAGWFSYIPGAPVEIIQSINYINFCFSFLLTGLSLLLIKGQRQLFEGSPEMRMFYGFYTMVWVSRVLIQLIWPWPSGLQLWLVVAFTTQLAMTLFPWIHFLNQGRAEGQAAFSHARAKKVE